MDMCCLCRCIKKGMGVYLHTNKATICCKVSYHTSLKNKMLMIEGQGWYVMVSSTTTPIRIKIKMGTFTHINILLSFAYTTKTSLSNINTNEFSSCYGISLPCEPS